MLKNLLAAALLSALACTAATAQEPPQMSPEKRALIKELLEITEATKNAEAVKNSMLAQQEKIIPEAFDRALEAEGSLTPAERRVIKNAMVAESAQVMTRLKEALDQKINFAQIVEEISLVVYDRYYTEQELRDLLAFYKSPTGRKTIQIMPQLFADSMQMTVERLNPKLLDALEQFIQEEKLRRMRQRPAAPPPPGSRRRSGD